MIVAFNRTARERIDGMLDLQGVPSAERWGRIQTAIDRLDDEHGADWRLKVLLSDSPEEASSLPRLVTRLRLAGLRHDSVREPGGLQGMVIAPAAASSSPQLLAA